MAEKQVRLNASVRLTLWKIALLCTGNERISEEFAGNAYACSCRAGNAPEHLTAAVMQLLRIFRSEACDPNPIDIAEASPLLELMHLPDSQRCLCAMKLCNIAESDMADILDCALADLSHNLKKMNRSLSFANGKAVSWEALQAAADMLQLSDEAVQRIDTFFEKKYTQKSEGARKIEHRRGGAVQEIIRNEETVVCGERKPIYTDTKGILLPIWALVLCITLPMVLVGVGTALLLQHQLPKHVAMSSAASVNSMVHISTTPAGEPVIDSPYLHFAEAREKALLYAKIETTDATFIKTQLTTTKKPVCYELTFLDKKGTQYDYVIDAQNGALIDYTTAPTKTMVNTQDFLPLEQIRQRALESAGLTDAIFTKEKLANNSDIYYYKIEFYDTVGKAYSVHLLATTGELLKYSVKEPNSTTIENAISIDVARQQALIRAGILYESQATFTKEKLDGSVYLLAFTIEDGTQYTIELDAQTGFANTVDVVLVSADTTNFIGFAKAKEIALEKAGTVATNELVYTKAKIDRDHAAYVYELEFETEDYSYEVRLNTLTGEVIKYRAWFR